MPKRSYAGEMELMVLLAVVRLGDACGLFCVVPGCMGFAVKKRMQGALARRRALELMRTALDEDTIVLPRK